MLHKMGKSSRVFVVRISKPIVLVPSIIIVAVALLTLMANLIIQSASVQEQFRKKAEEIIGMPVTMGKVSFNPFTGFYLPSLVVTDPIHHRSAEAISLDFVPEFLPLLRRYWGMPLNAMEEWSGHLNIKTVILDQRFSLQNIKASLKKTASTFSVDPFTATVAQGKLTGYFLLQQDHGLSPYQLNVHFSGLSLAKLTDKDGVNSLNGGLQGAFSMKRVLEDPEKREGAGTLEATGMQIKPGGFLAQIGQLLQIQELQMLKLHEATASYTIAPHYLLLKSLRLNADNVMIRAHGTVSYEGALHLNALLLINAKMQARLQGLLPLSGLISSVELGYVEFPFNVTGTLKNPQSNLFERIPLPAVNNNVQGIIKQILNF